MSSSGCHWRLGIAENATGSPDEAIGSAGTHESLSNFAPAIPHGCPYRSAKGESAPASWAASLPRCVRVYFQPLRLPSTNLLTSSWVIRRTINEQSACTPLCTTGFRNILAYHALMKTDLRISVKDYRRSDLSDESDESDESGGSDSE